MEKVIMGNHAVSYGVRLARAQVISAYPITPQTQIVEMLSEFCADGSLDAQFIKVESEHSAMAAVVGAAFTGARTFTATSSHGLAYMHEVLHWASGARLPIVLANVNRALGPGWCIGTEQTDSLAQRDTGWMQFYCETNQEVLDTIIQAYRIAETVGLPAMVVLAGFVLSHTEEPVNIPDQEQVDRFLPSYRPQFYLTPGEPHAFNSLVSPDDFMELRFKMQRSMEEAVDVISAVGAEFQRVFGRKYDLTEAYRVDDAELVLVTAGSITSTARFVVDEMRALDKRVGLLKIRVFRPFPFAAVRAALGRVAKVAVIDRNISFGCGGIFSSELQSAFCAMPDAPLFFSFIAGLGGRDVTPETIRGIAESALVQSVPTGQIEWVEVKR